MSDRRVILKMVLSLDGFVTSPDGTHEWMFEWFGEGSGRRRNHPGPRRPRLRHVADPPGPRRRIPADDGPDCYRRGPQPIRRAGRAPEAGRRRREALLERSPRADPGAEAIGRPGAVTDHAQRG